MRQLLKVSGHCDLSMSPVNTQDVSAERDSCILVMGNQRRGGWRQLPKPVQPMPRYGDFKDVTWVSWCMRKWKQSTTKPALPTARLWCTQHRTHRAETMYHEDSPHLCLQPDREEATLKPKTWLNGPVFGQTGVIVVPVPGLAQVLLSSSCLLYHYGLN